MTTQILQLLENPLIIIALTVIILTVVLAIIITQPNLVGKILRKYLKLNTDDETAKFSLDIARENEFIQDINQVKNMLKSSKK